MEYKWPGNVCELHNVVEHALIFNPTGPISIKDISIPIKKELQVRKEKVENYSSDNLDKIVYNYIHKILKKTNGKIHGPCGAAELMGVNPSTLRNRMRNLKINYTKK